MSDRASSAAAAERVSADRYANGILGHAVPTEQRRLQLLQDMLDPETFRILSSLELGPTARCLELGAGEGSVARWLGEHRPDGSVLATDTELSFLEGSAGPNVEVRRHDVTRDDLPPSSFDLIHARMLFNNIQERDAVLRRVVGWLAPGGWLVIEEPDAFPCDSSPYPAFRRAIQAFERMFSESHGADTRWARGLPIYLTKAGLVDLGLSVNMQPAGNGAAVGNEFWRIFMTQLGPRMVDAEMLSDIELKEVLALFDDPTFVEAAHATVSAWARKPPSE